LKMGGEEGLASLLDLLALILEGRATVSVGGYRFLSINADTKTLEVEAEGVGEAGLHLSDFVKQQEGPANILEGSMHVGGSLSRLGWKLTLYAEGDRILSMGRGVSRLTGRIKVNPLKLKKILKVLK
jgi:hypothetical protein